ncbi:MAG: hypothetical protein II453_14690 [Alphaproteobacteria bacterium]|nr:hypothetical protein [Alphaproteobacteria bacterium]
MGFEKGHKKLGGREVGTPNKATGDIKQMVRDALSEVGGVDYLKTQAKSNPTAFLGLIKSIVPRDVNVGGQTDNELIIKIKGLGGGD